MALETPTSRGIYHEKQTRELCALHSLNNLFQNPLAFSKNDLDSICQRLSPDNWVNPHKSVLGTGNYDINVIMAALETKGCSAMWFDKRKDPSSIVIDLVVGFILNIPSEYKIGPVPLPLKRKHWVAVKNVDGAFYNLDSKLDFPSCIGQKTELIQWLRSELSSREKELFIIVSEEVGKSRSWSIDATATNGTNDDSDWQFYGNLITENECDAHNGSMLSNGDKKRKMLASIEGEEAFTAPGLKFIDSDAVSVENSQGNELLNHKNKEVTR